MSERHPAAALQGAEIAAGVAVGLGSIVVAVPGRVDELAAAVLLPIVALVVYGMSRLVGGRRAPR